MIKLEEKLKKVSWHDDHDNYVIGYNDAFLICQEHYEEIIALIDKMINENNRSIEQMGYKYAYEQRNASLTELKQKLEKDNGCS